MAYQPTEKHIARVNESFKTAVQQVYEYLCKNFDNVVSLPCGEILVSFDNGIDIPVNVRYQDGTNSKDGGKVWVVIGYLPAERGPISSIKHEDEDKPPVDFKSIQLERMCDQVNKRRQIAEERVISFKEKPCESMLSDLDRLKKIKQTDRFRINVAYHDNELLHLSCTSKITSPEIQRCFIDDVTRLITKYKALTED